MCGLRGFVLRCLDGVLHLFARAAHTFDVIGGEDLLADRMHDVAVLHDARDAVPQHCDRAFARKHIVELAREFTWHADEQFAQLRSDPRAECGVRGQAGMGELLEMCGCGRGGVHVEQCGEWSVFICHQVPLIDTP